MAKNNKTAKNGKKEKKNKKVETVNENVSTLVATDDNVTKEEVIEEITSPENVGNLEKELNEEYGMTETPESPEGDADEKESELVETLDEIKETTEKVETITSLEDIQKMTDPKEINEALNKKLDELEETEKIIENKLSAAEKKLERAKIDLKNRRATNFWGGVRFT